MKSSHNGIALLIFATLVSCGGGGGGSGNSSGISSGISEKYYPATQNSIWVYDATDSAHSDSYFDTIKITGTKSVSGVNTIVFTEDNPEGSGVPVENYYYKDKRAFSFFGNNDQTDVLNPLVVPYDEMRFDGTFSSSPIIQKSDLNVGSDLDGDGINDLLDILMVGTVDGYETLATTAGTFLDTARLKISITGTYKLSGGANIPITESVTEWRAPGVGTVKQTISVSVNGTVSSSTMNIHGYVVGSLKGGYLAPQTLASNLVLQASSDLDRPGKHAVGSDGNNFLLVSRQETGMQITSPLSKWVGQIVSADGTSQASFDLSPSTTSFGGEAAVAFDGTNYLVLSDETYRIIGTPFIGIVGQRVSTTGVIIDTYPGVTISATGMNPSVAFGGGTYLVVYRNSAYGNPNGIYGVLVSPSGIVGSEFPISTSSANVGFPSVAFDGTNFLVAWESGGTQSDPSTTDIYGARVSLSGTVLDSSAIAISTAPEAQISPQVACDGTNCMVVWIDRRNIPGPGYLVPMSGDVYAAILSKDGVLLNGLTPISGIPVATTTDSNYVFPGVVFTGSEYLVAWTQFAYVGPRGVYGVRISTSGSITGSAISLSGPPAYGSMLTYVSIAMSQSEALVTWLNNSVLSGSGTSKSIEGALAFP